MNARRGRLKEAKTRVGMRSLNVWLPESVHRALALIRVEDEVSTNEIIRAAVRAWLSRRNAARKLTKVRRGR